MKILFTGGGTLGPVTPLLAVAEAWRQIDPTVEFVWVGTRFGPERAPVEAARIRFLHIPVARLPRYVSLEWFTLPFTFLAAFIMSWLTVRRERPNLIATAGGYTGVPLAIAGSLQGIPTWLHQQDARPILASRLVAPFATCITVAWERLTRSFPLRKTDWIGNPVRPSILEGKRDKAFDIFGIDLSRPTVLVTGGGTGASWINQMMEDVGEVIASQANVIHVTGRGKRTAKLASLSKRYHAVEFLTDEMAHALAAADLVVCRGGMGTTTELAAWHKPAIVIPIPGSLQDDNAKILADAHAAIVLHQSLTSVGDFKAAILGLLEDKKKQQELGKRISATLPTDVSETLVHHVRRHCGLDIK